MRFEFLITLWAADVGWDSLYEYRPHVLLNKVRIQIRSPLVPLGYGVLPCSKSHTCYWCVSPWLHLSFRVRPLSLVFLPRPLHSCLFCSWPSSGSYPILSIVPWLPLSHPATCLTFWGASSLWPVTGVINSLPMFPLAGYHSAPPQGEKRQLLIPHTSTIAPTSHTKWY